jgi:hypothetical protein
VEAQRFRTALATQDTLDRTGARVLFHILTSRASVQAATARSRAFLNFYGQKTALIGNYQGLWMDNLLKTEVLKPIQARTIG